MRVSMIGTGYVGLVTGVGLAELGHHVVCVDSDQEKIDTIRRGEVPFFEPGLEPLLQRTLGERLDATTDLRRAVLETELSLIAVGTPSRDDGAIDLSSVEAVARQVGEALRDKAAYHVVVVKSTVVPGTTEDVVLPLLEQTTGKRAGPDFGLGMNPEFLTEGEAVQDFLFPDRLVLGAIDERTHQTLDALYAGLPRVERMRTTPRTAEMIKYASNALLATLISFSNEVGNLCAALGKEEGGVDVAEVMQGLHLSKYLRHSLPDGSAITAPLAAFLWPGCGFGGSCLPKDVKAIIARGRRAGVPMPLLDAVIGINERQPRQILTLLHRHYPSLQGVRVAVLGLAFRPDTNDMRESPAIPIIHDLLAQGAELTAYDPAANAEARRLFGNGRLRVCDDLPEAVRDVDAVVLVTRWDEFRRLPELLRRGERQPVVIDGRRMLDKASVPRYEGIGL
ncbi:MAG TPA: UDP-glucose/GDP-mannose dehydrogenase family protein [Gemmatimonadales bacterium]